jgi:hypothetical protein
MHAFDSKETSHTILCYRCRDHIDTLHNLRENYPSLYLHVLGLEEVGHVLGPGVFVHGVVVVVIVRVVCRANVLHLVHGSALHAARLGLLTGKGDPEDIVRIGGEAGATNVLLVTGRVDGDGVLHRACIPSALHHTTGSPNSGKFFFFLLVLETALRTETAGVQWPHVEDVDTLHLSENFETLETGRLLSIGGNGTGLRTRGQKILLGLDFYRIDLVSN